MKTRYTAISGELPKGYHLVRPLDVEVWVEAGEVVASSFELLLTAFGDTEETAFANLKEAIVGRLELYQGHTRLSPNMRRNRDHILDYTAPDTFTML